MCAILQAAHPTFEERKLRNVFSVSTALRAGAVRSLKIGPFGTVSLFLGECPDVYNGFGSLEQ